MKKIKRLAARRVKYYGRRALIKAYRARRISLRTYTERMKHIKT